MKKKIILAVVILILLSSFLRLYRIFELTEFLGDQGRTGIVIYDTWVNKSIPLAGPTVLTGQHLGPFFYYLIAPAFILFNFNPIAPAIFTAILGIFTVLLMFYMGNKLFGFWIGFFIATLYTVSPSIVTSDRILWEPNIIPFFILLFILAIYKIREERNFRYFLLLGTTSGALIQLHYPNVFVIVLAFLFWVYITLMRRNSGSVTTLILWTMISVFAFFAVLFPFLAYETRNDFVDLREIALIFLSSSRSVESSSPFYHNFLDYSSRLFKNSIPLQQSWYFSLTQLLIILFPILVHIRGGIRRHLRDQRFWYVFFSFWFIAGVLAMSLYKGVVYDHYLMFLLPLPFFLFGSFLNSTILLFEQSREHTLTKLLDSRAKHGRSKNKHITPKTILTLSILLLIALNLSKTDIFSKGNNDLDRTQEISNEIIEQSNNEPFSFTLISSRSFSDLHYRYYFKIHNIEPKDISSNDYNLLFLVCEKNPCPTENEMREKVEVQALCYDPHCEGEYPKVDLRKFQFISSKNVFDGIIFTYIEEASINIGGIFIIGYDTIKL